MAALDSKLTPPTMHLWTGWVMARYDGARELGAMHAHVRAVRTQALNGVMHSDQRRRTRGVDLTQAGYSSQLLSRQAPLKSRHRPSVPRHRVRNDRPHGLRPGRHKGRPGHRSRLRRTHLMPLKNSSRSRRSGGWLC